MSVSLESQLKLINLDVAQEVGSAAAIIKNIPVTVSDGKLNINFTATVNRPMVCAVEVYKFSSAAAITEASMQTFEPVAEVAKPFVYPNPIKDKFRIGLPTSNYGNITLEISDQMGRLYKLGASDIRTTGSTMEVDVSSLNLRTGVYYLKIYSKKSTEVVKLLVQ
jgi:hypothetical protein